jgi:hypothetical protein
MRKTRHARPKTRTNTICGLRYPAGIRTYSLSRRIRIPRKRIAEVRCYTCCDTRTNSGGCVKRCQLVAAHSRMWNIAIRSSIQLHDPRHGLDGSHQLRMAVQDSMRISTHTGRRISHTCTNVLYCNNITPVITPMSMRIL